MLSKIIFSLLLLVNTVFCFSQYSYIAKVGVGLVNFNGAKGVGGNSEIIFSLNDSFDYGFNFEYALASDKEFNNQITGSYDKYSCFSGDIQLYFTPRITNNISFVMFAGSGIRYNNSISLLVNSDRQIQAFNNNEIDLGFKLGLGFDYYFSEYHSISLIYSRDLYKEGYDYYRINFGFMLN